MAFNLKRNLAQVFELQRKKADEKTNSSAEFRPKLLTARGTQDGDPTPQLCVVTIGFELIFLIIFADIFELMMFVPKLLVLNWYIISFSI